jgi:hypothetical protein
MSQTLSFGQPWEAGRTKYFSIDPLAVPVLYLFRKIDRFPNPAFSVTLHFRMPIDPPHPRMPILCYTQSAEMRRSRA